MRCVLATLLEELSDDLKVSEEATMLRPLADHKVYNIVHLIYRSKHYEGHSKDYEFSRLTMEDHWRAGYHDAARTAASSGARAAEPSGRCVHLRPHSDWPGVKWRYRWKGENAMARTYREIAIEEMLGTVEEAMSQVIDWWGDLPPPMKEAIEQFRIRLGVAIDSVEFVKRALDRQVHETDRGKGPA